jgi:hypothetical protein
MRVLVGCEFSQVVTKAFRDKGHEAFSCDILDCEINPQWHYKCDVLDIINEDWDLAIFHPPCTHLASSGARWFKNKQKEQAEAIDFFFQLAYADIDKIAIENPVGIMSSKWRKPDQIIQPWQFGESFQKTTCLWLKNLSKLVPTNIVSKGSFHITKSGRKLPKWYNLPPSADRGKIRSKTFSGIAQAMADQWI